MRSAFFFILSAIIAGLIIFFGINPPNLKPIKAVDGHIRGDKTVFLPSDFLNFAANENFAIMPFGKGAGSSIGVRIVSFKPSADGENDGAILHFSPEFTKATQGKTLRIATIAPPIPYKASEEFAIGLSDGENIIWSRALVKPETEAAVIESQSPPKGVKSLIINPDTKGGGKGIDLISIAVKVF